VADVLFHYTSRASAQSIRIGGRLRPGRGGKLYLTPTPHESGAEASASLSILGKAVEVVLVVPLAAARGLTDPSVVEPILGADGRELRPGGGLEQITGYDVVSAGLVNWSLSWP
jgi:hypothetical protein